MAQIFISYRRHDSFPYASQIGEKLRASFGDGAVFFDLRSIQAGAEFPLAILETIQKSRVVLVLIGKNWLSIQDVNGTRRLDDPSDWVRQEIVAARDSVSHVIPILVGGATMPRSDDLPEALAFLASRNAVELRDAHFDVDCEELAKAIEKISRLRRKAQGRPVWRTILGVYTPRGLLNLFLRVAYVAAALVLLLLLAGLSLDEYLSVKLVLAAVVLVARAAELYLD